MDGNKGKVIQLLATVVAFGLLLGGCAANGRLANDKISLGEKALNEAKDSNASLNAPAELNVAEGNLVKAKEALAQKEYKQATRLAERASIDADYARNRAITEKAKESAEDMKKNIEALRQEIERLSKP
jgi:hypothetical protein